MIHYIADAATQPVDWTAKIGTWVVVGTVAIGGVTTLILLALSKLKEIREAWSAAMQAKSDAAEAKAVSNVNSQRITNVSNHATAIYNKLTDIALATPTAENIRKAFDASKPDVT